MAQESNPSNELYDFLYFDSARAKRYCAQLFDDGVLESQARHQESGGTLSHSANLDIKIASGTRKSCETSASKLHQHYDTTDLLPLLLLDGLKSYAAMAESISAAKLGKLFLVEGHIKIVDIRSLQGLWEPTFDLVKNQVSLEHKGTPGGKNHARKARTEFDVLSKGMLGILQNLPNTVHMWLASDGSLSWSTLHPENMLVNPDDILLKHGTHLPGKWSVLGILDAMPSFMEDNTYLFDAGEGLLQGMEEMICMLRTQMGRSPDSYGITPIAIFRDSNI